MKRKQIILLGDSITQLSFSPSGFGSHIANIYQRRADVLNRGFAGYNTKWICNYLDTKKGLEDTFGTAAGNPNVLLVTIFFGANDASDALLNPRHHVPIDQYKSNLKQIIALVKKHCPNANILIISPPPVQHEQRLQYQISRYGRDKATGKLERNMTLSKQYATAAEEVAKEYDNIPNLNLWQEMQKNENWHVYLCDGLHLSAEGNTFVGSCLERVIFKEFPSLKIDSCPFTGNWAVSASKSQLAYAAPWHDEIDYQNSAAAFSQHEDGGEGRASL